MKLFPVSVEIYLIDPDGAAYKRWQA